MITICRRTFLKFLSTVDVTFKAAIYDLYGNFRVTIYGRRNFITFRMFTVDVTFSLTVYEIRNF